MSAFVCIFHRDGEPLEARDLQRLAEPLAGYGDDTATYCRGPLGIAVRHRGGSGAQLRYGPLADLRNQRVAAVAGRIELVAVDGAGRATLGGAAAALEGLAETGGNERDPLAGWCGSFALVVADLADGRVRIFRDHLGGAAVYYHLAPRLLVAASDPVAVLRHPDVSGDLDEASVARFLGFRFPHGERSFFRQVRLLPPAHRLEVAADGHLVERYWRFRRLPPSGDRPPEELSAELRRRLETSVARAVAGTDPGRVALSLSGGLDSPALAAVAPPGVRAFSWTFADTPEADERPRVEEVSRRLGMPVVWVAGDGLHPLADGFVERFVDPGSPFINAFAALKCRLYEVAREAGCERVMVGDGGDALYAAREYWLRDLLADRQPGALRSLAGTARRAARGDRFARRTLRRLVPDRLRSTLHRDPRWLTAHGCAALPAPAFSPILPPGPGSARHELTVGTKHSEIESEERRLFAQCGVERANPFWSWPLLEAAIQLPAYLYHRDGRDKVLSRAAMRDLLPPSVVEGERVGMLGRFFLRGIEHRRDELRETVFRHPRSDWPRFVRRDWVEPYLDDTRTLGFGHTVLWRVVSYELWTRRRLGVS